MKVRCVYEWKGDKFVNGEELSRVDRLIFQRIVLSLCSLLYVNVGDVGDGLYRFQ